MWQRSPRETEEDIDWKVDAGVYSTWSVLNNLVTYSEGPLYTGKTETEKRKKRQLTISTWKTWSLNHKDVCEISFVWDSLYVIVMHVSVYITNSNIIGDEKSCVPPLVR